MSSELNCIPKTSLNFLPTPLTRLKRLSEFLGGPEIYIKRDDLTGLALGGNKTRKLEYLLGDAIHQGCDTVITGGAMQSNHSRQTAAAARATGLECHLALGGQAPPAATGNLLLDHLFGAILHWCGPDTKGEKIPEISEELKSKGKKPYIIPFGGSNPVGTLGFAAAAEELAGQLTNRSLSFDYIILPSSSGGTQAGLVLGAHLSDLRGHIIGIGIDRHESGHPSYESEMADLANRTAAGIGISHRFTSNDFRMDYHYFGGGYGVVSDLEREAITLTAGLEGILLDPVYTGRTMGALIDLIRKKVIQKGQNVLFWHTGGLPILFDYAPQLVLSS